MAITKTQELNRKAEIMYKTISENGINTISAFFNL
ncbi:hypothetical protein lse_1175 [Listeria seeligeri serovar 1/2b str. SLCC3954]|nr:hypothetical protein lse_1175 [Listeria seeligeri serovar 1/2b str. SLCC3954]